MQALWNLLNALINNPQLIVVMLVVFGPAIGKIYKSLSEKAAQRKAQIALERARIDALRTGGRIDGAGEGTVMTAEGPQPSARRSLEELARRRRAEIGGVDTTTSLPQTQSRAPSTQQSAGNKRANIPEPVRFDTQPRPQTSQSTPARQQRQRNSKQQQRQQAQQQSQSRQPQAVRKPAVQTSRAAYIEESDVPKRTTKDTPAALSPSQKAALASETDANMGVLRSMSRREWRRAILTQEILGQPVGMRS